MKAVKRWKIGDIVWLVMFTKHRYVRYVAKKAKIEYIETGEWEGGGRTVYQTSLDCSADRESSDFCTTKAKAVAECEKRNLSASRYRQQRVVAERRQKREEAKELAQLKPALTYDSPSWIGGSDAKKRRSDERNIETKIEKV